MTQALPSESPPPPVDVQMKWGIQIPLRDGLKLSAILYLPRNRPGSSPAIVTLTPYIAQSHHEQGMYFAAHGYPFLSVDVRGRGNSEGEFHPLNESRDAHDVIEWLAYQPYCNGKVAMWGLSYMGYCQWAAVKENPAHLATIVPVASPYRGVDSPLRNNVFAAYTMQWLTGIAGRTLQDKVSSDQTFWRGKFREWFESGASFESLDTCVGNPSSLFQEWITHPQQDDYWASHNPTPDEYVRLTMPVLTITGIYDADQLGALAHYREFMKHASPKACAGHYLIIGPWDHAGTRTPKQEICGFRVGPASLVDLPKLHLDWYSWTMQGGQKPAFLCNKVAYYVMAADRWRYADTLESVTARHEPLYLQSQASASDTITPGSLVACPPPRNEPDQYVYNPMDVSLAALESAVDPEDRVDQRMLLAAAGKRLIYLSAPFEQDTEISGFFKLSAWLSIDQPDTDFRVTICEVAPDGSAVQLTVDWMRARFRQSFREAHLIETTEPLQYNFERFMFVSRQISRGDRLRLVIGPIDSIYWQRNFNSGRTAHEESVRDARPVTVKLYHDAAHPSALQVPLGIPG